MVRDAVAIFAGLLAFVGSILLFHHEDRSAFTCILKQDARTRAQVYFVPGENEFDYTSKGGVPCIEHAVNFVNKMRAGEDKIIGTPDDTITLERQINILYSTLEKNFPGGYWVYSPFFYTYELPGVPVLTQFIYIDLDEVLMLKVAPAGMNTVLSAWDGHRYLIPLQGHFTAQRSAPLRPLHITADEAPILKPLDYSSPAAESSIRIKAGTELSVSAGGGEPVVYLEYASIHALRQSLTNFALLPLLFGFDYKSPAISFSSLYKSLYHNAWLPLWEEDEVIQHESELSKYKTEYIFRSQNSEIQSEEVFNTWLAQHEEELREKELKRLEQEALEAAKHATETEEGFDKEDTEKNSDFEDLEEALKQAAAEEEAAAADEEEADDGDHDEEEEEEEDDDGAYQSKDEL